MNAIISQIGNARERYEAMQQGKPVPPKTSRVKLLSDELTDEIMTEFAKALAAMYHAEKYHSAKEGLA